jgi:hypothetical protein
MALYPRRVTSTPTSITVSSGGIDFASLPLQTWTEMPNSTFNTSGLKEALDADGATLYSYGSDKVGAALTNFNGMAWDYVNGRAWATGGGHHGGSDNSVFKLNLNTMQWSVDSIGTKVGKDGFTAEDADLYARSKDYTVYGGGPTFPPWNPATLGTNPYKRAYSRSSTGFAVNTGSTFSQIAWREVPGPAGPFANEAEYNAFLAAPDKLHFPAIQGANSAWDIMADGRPSTRHWYGGQFYLPTRDEIFFAVRGFWRYKPGTGWDLCSTYYKVPQYNHAEKVWFQYDEINDVIYNGGCGSDCVNNGYFFYSNGVKINPVTQTEVAVNFITDWNSSRVLSGDSMIVSFKAGRWIGGVGGIDTPDKGWSFHLDTSEKRILTFVGASYTGSRAEGNACVYIPETGKLWLFDTHTNSLPCWEYDIDAQQAGGPGGTYTVASRLKSFSNASSLPVNNAGLMYNRVTYWQQKKVLVYVPSDNANVWVCRVI